MATDREILKQQQAGVAQTSGATDPIGEVGKIHEVEYTWLSDSAAAFAEVGYVVLKKCKTKNARVLPSSTLATDGTNYITGTFAYRDGAGGSATTLGTFTTNSSGGAALTAFVPTTVSLTHATLSAGNVVTFKTVDAGTTTEPLLTATLTCEYV
jgi:hypothetical protein